ncbi:AAA family ATPase [Fusobacterium russii]|uniref:AAA family ATPase n=1 Tax=Fusobacterium russii TaxID=854 RepID=UPI0003A99A47|nr:AAA family ATPase [Fusobacterium russii]
MFPIFMWVKEYKGLKNFEITFDNDYEISCDKVLSTKNSKFEKGEKKTKNFYSINIDNIENVNLIIGKNGVGKTNILEMLSLNDKKLYNTFFFIGNVPNNEKILKLICGEPGLEYMRVYKIIAEDKKELLIAEIGSRESIRKIYRGCCEYEKELLKKIKESGIVKFCLSSMKSSLHQRNRIANDDIQKDDKRIYTLNISLKTNSKKYIYNYLISQNRENNNRNYKDAYLLLTIPRLYENTDEYKKINEILKKYFNNEKVKIESKLKLYEILEKDNLKKIILKNFCNYTFLYFIYDLIREKNSKNEIEEIINEELENKKSMCIDELVEYFLKEFLKEKIGIADELYKNILKFMKLFEKIEELKKIEKLEKLEELEDNKENIINYKINSQEYCKLIEEIMEEFDSITTPNERTKTMNYLETDGIYNFFNIEESGMSDGEKIKLQYFSTLYGVLEGEFRDKKYITLLFDEVEAFLHPEWSRIFLYELIKELEEKYPGKKFKLIFATHSPFLIADVLAKDCIYLEKQNGKIEAKIDSSKKTFGANIIDLFKNTMFLDSTFGKFATEKIKWVVDKIDKESYTDIKNNPEINYIIEEIGEKLISNKLKSMIESKLENKGNAKEYYKNKIEEYQAKIKKIEEEEGEK